MTQSMESEKKGPPTTKQLLAVAPEDTLGEVAEKMLSLGTHAALVVDYGRVIGVLSAEEVTRAVAERAHPSDGRAREWMAAVRTEEAPTREAALCQLAWELGDLEACPGEACTFWWEGACVLAGLSGEIAEDPNRARFFLRLRATPADAEGQRSLRGLPGS